jgi:hypothetical protein
VENEKSIIFNSLRTSRDIVGTEFEFDVAIQAAYWIATALRPSQ